MASKSKKSAGKKGAQKPKSAAPKGATRKASKPGQKPVGEGKAPEQRVTSLPPKGFIKNFVTNTLPGIENDLSSLRGDLGSAIKNAKENKHVETRALAMVRRLHKMPDRKFTETWEHLQEYFEEMGFQKRYDSMPRFDLKPPAAEDGEGEPEENGEGEGETKEQQEELAGSPGGNMLKIVPQDEAA